MPGAATTPRVSVVMSTLNRAGTLSRAIDSVLGQEGSVLELVVVDDGSGDGTPSVLERYAGDSRVRVVRNDRNLGLPASLNRGIAGSRGEFIARIDDDDVWTDTAKIARQLNFMDNHPDTGLLGTGYVDEWEQRVTNPVTDAAIRRQMLFRCPFCHPSVVVRKRAIEAAGFYDENLPYAEDWDLWLRIGRQWRLANLPATTLVKNPGPGNLSERYFLRQLKMASGFAAKYASDYPRSTTARAYHAAARAFFRAVPAGGRLHTRMGKAFRRGFGLDRG